MKEVKMLALQSVNAIDPPKVYCDLFNKWYSCEKIHKGKAVKSIINQFVLRELEHVNPSSRDKYQVAFYDNGDFEIRNIEDVPVSINIENTDKRIFGLPLLLISLGCGQNRQMTNLDIYRGHYDFSNYNPTEVEVSRSGNTITLEYKHETYFDITSLKGDFNASVIPGISGGLSLLLQNEPDIKISCKEEGGYTVVDVSAEGLNVDKTVDKTKILIDSFMAFGNEPQKIVDYFYNLGLIDLNACITHFVQPEDNYVSVMDGFEMKMPVGEKLSCLISEIINNWVSYQFKEEKVAIALYPDDSVLFYKVKDEEESRNLTGEEISNFYIGIRAGNDYKQRLINE